MHISPSEMKVYPLCASPGCGRRFAVNEFIAFEKALSDLIFNDKKYGSKEGDICDNVFMNIWDLMDELRDIYKL